MSWLPRQTQDYLQGEDRLSGQVISVAGWFRWSDKKKVRKLRDLAEYYGSDPHMRWFVVNQILRGRAVQRDYKGQAAALLRYVQSFYYTNEPGEQIQSPWRTLAVRTGDCDDLALLLAAMAHSIGLPWRFVLAGKDRKGQSIRWAEGTPGPPWKARFAHIYVDIGWPPFHPSPTYAAAEPTIKGAPLGYDVIRDGMKRWGERAPSLSQMNASIMPELAGWGNAMSAVRPGRQAHALRPQARPVHPYRQPYRPTARQLRPTTPSYTPRHQRGTGYAGPTLYGDADAAVQEFDARRAGLLGVPWGQVLVGVIEGTITAIVIALLLKQLKI